MSKEQGSTTVQTANKPVRPVLIVSEHTVYEYSAFLEHLLAGLADESIAPGLVCPATCDVDSITPSNVQVIRFPTFDLPFMGWQNRRVLQQQLAAFKPTVLHCLCEGKAALTKGISAQMNLPYVLSVSSPQKKWTRLPVSTRRCSKIIVPAKSIGAGFAKAHPRLADRIQQVNPGTFAAEARAGILQPGRPASMVTIHPLDRIGNFENVLAAVRHLVIEGYELIFAIMGQGRAERHLRRLLAALGLLGTVVIVPRLKNWRSVVSAGDIYIRLEPTESFDPYVLEAMSAGTVTAACIRGVDELLVDGQTCVTFEPDNELSIYNNLQRLFDRPEFARKLAEGARQYIRQNHSVSKMVGDILQCYRDAQQRYEQQ